MDGLAGGAARYEEHQSLAQACEGLARTAPDRSAVRVVSMPQALAAVIVLPPLLAAFVLYPLIALETAHLAALAVFTAVILFRVAAAAAGLSPPRAPPAFAGPVPVLTVLCPLYKEETVVADLIRALQRLDYPTDALDVKLILEADDETTRAALQRLVLPAYMEVLTVPVAAPRTKPKALNYALAFARGDIVTVFDAEDRPHPAQPRAALAAFAAGGERLACVQAPLLADNANASWIAGQFAAEYAVQFASIVPFFARLGLPFPLGGTSNYFRLEALRAVGAWDPHNVTEDADIGYRLARSGYCLGAIAPPTLEEAPVSLRAWLRQRTRWIKGHLQTWLVLMRNPWRTARELGLAGFLAMQLALGGGLLAAFLHAPLALWLIAVSLAPAWSLTTPDFALAVSGYAAAVYAAAAGAAAAGRPGLIGAALTMPLYWPLASIAALCSLGELVFKPHYWAKTAHGVSARGADDAADHAVPLLPRPRGSCGQPRLVSGGAPY